VGAGSDDNLGEVRVAQARAELCKVGLEDPGALVLLCGDPQEGECTPPAGSARRRQRAAEPETPALRAHAHPQPLRRHIFAGV
jgi:hypothetical protein